MACPDYAQERITGLGRAVSRYMLNCFHEKPKDAQASKPRKCSRHPVVQNLELIKGMLQFQDGVDEDGTRDRLAKPIVLKSSKSTNINQKRFQGKKRKFSATFCLCRRFIQKKKKKTDAKRPTK